MKSALYHGYDTNKDIVEECDDINSFLDSIKYCIGDKVLLVEDVTTSGKSIYETMPILKEQAEALLN